MRQIERLPASLTAAMLLSLGLVLLTANAACSSPRALFAVARGFGRTACVWMPCGTHLRKGDHVLLVFFDPQGAVIAEAIDPRPEEEEWCGVGVGASEVRGCCERQAVALRPSISRAHVDESLSVIDSLSDWDGATGVVVLDSRARVRLVDGRIQVELQQSSQPIELACRQDENYDEPHFFAWRGTSQVWAATYVPYYPPFQDL